MKSMQLPDNINKDAMNWHGWHGPIRRPPVPREPEPGLSIIGKLHWQVREYLRPKSAWERIGINLAKSQKQ